MNLHGCADMHLHSSCSDGSLSPGDLVDKVKSMGLSCVALTDHETTSGVFEAQKRADEVSVKFLPGVELNGVTDDLGLSIPKGTALHVLGYFSIRSISNLDYLFGKLALEREKRNRAIVAKAVKNGVTMRYEDIVNLADGNVITRGHFARYMMNIGMGVNGHLRDTIDEYFIEGKPFYVPREEMGTIDCIKTIKEAGGVCVIAHPGLIKVDYGVMDQIFRTVKANGADGVETIYTEYTEEQTRTLTLLARKHDLKMTGGSDFHGTLKPTIEPGIGFGNLRILEEYVQWLFDELEYNR